MDLKLKDLSEDSSLTDINYYVESAWLGHAPFLRFLLREIKPDTFVELGTHNGFSYFVACQTIQELDISTKAFAIDHWAGDPHAGTFDHSVFINVREKNENYKSFSSLMKMRFSEALSKFDDYSIDLLHIDGFHTYSSVKEDFETWLPKMNKEGIILMHDIHVYRSDFGVYKFWNEIKSRYRTFEFLHSHGLGVVLLGGKSNSIYLDSLLASKTFEMSSLQGAFASLGDISTQQFCNYERSIGEKKLISAQLEIAQLKGQIQEVESTLNRLLRSKSWKLTGPLRNLLLLLLRLK